VLYVKPAVIFIPGYDLRLEMRRTLLHCDQRMYEVEALAIGERGWSGARALHETGQVEVIVTTSNSGHTMGPFVEVAGAGRTAIRTPARAARLRQIADLVDSGLSTEEIIRILAR
jgi:voltage-gated potassium channel Kch